MAEQPSSAWLSGGSTGVHNTSSGGNTAPTNLTTPASDAPHTTSETIPQRGRLSNSRKRSKEAGTEHGGKRGRPSSRSTSRGRLPAETVTVRSGKVSTSTGQRGRPSVLQARHSVRTSTSTTSSHASHSVSSEAEVSSPAVVPAAATAATAAAARGRRAVTAASSAATASAAAAAAARKRNVTKQRATTNCTSNKPRGASTSSSSASTSGQSSSTSVSATVVQPRKHYPLRNQVRLVGGSEVPLQHPRPSPDYYSGVQRRSLPSRSPATQRAPRASLTAGEKRLRSQQSQQAQQAAPQVTSPLISVTASLRRSSRSKATTGSCASSSGRRTSRGGTKLPVSGAGPSSSSPQPSSSSSVIVQATSSMQQQPPQSGEGVGPGWEEGSASTSATPPPLPPPAPHSSGQASFVVAAAAAAAAAAADSESDDSEVGLSCTSTSSMLHASTAARTATSVGRLQALLEARGLPPHLFGALGPRMQHLLHRSMGGGSSGGGASSKVQQLLQGLTATGDEGAQLTAVIEMCQMLVMGNEDTLAGFPVKQVVPALIALLSMEHNFDMMNHACRALTYMMEALPRSSAVVVDAVPVFLEKLQVIQCMDVAEQSLTALEMLSRRHGKAILQARGVSSCLTYLDFFSINAQRAALATTANCCMNLHPDEFHLVSDSLPLLASRLAQQDKRSMESVCLAFSRLVDSFQLDPVRLRCVASAELLANLQRLLVVSPQLVSTGTFITVLRMLSVMCANCPSLARDLLRHNVADTLLFLLTGNATSVPSNDEVELVSRSPQELYEITCLIGELMPRLPTDGLFAVDALLERAPPTAQDAVSWQWRDDRELWQPYTTMDSRIIEAAHQEGEDEISLSTLGRTYTIDFHSMQQINEDTGTTRPVHRRVLPTGGVAKPSPAGQSSEQQEDAEKSDCEEEKTLAAGFIRSLFSVLYEVYSSSAGPSVRCKCLRALLRMVHFASADLLKEVLRCQVVSSHLAGMLASQDLRIVVGALQMAYILMDKLPTEFGVHFRREGVMHQIQRLAETPLPQTPGPSSTPANGALSVPAPSGVQPSPVRSLLQDDDTPPSPAMRVGLTEVLKRKRSTPKRASSSSSSRKTRQDEAAATLNALAGGSSSSAAREFFRAAALSSSSSSSGSVFGSAVAGSAAGRSRFSGAKSSFLASLNPARWGRSSTVGAAAASSSAAHNGQAASEHRHKECVSKSSSGAGLAAGNKEKARQWVREQAQRFVELYFENEASGPPHPALTVLSRLTQAIEKLKLQPWQGEVALRELRDIVLTSDISPFEVNHSGLISALVQYLTHEPEPVLPVHNNNNNNNEDNVEPRPPAVLDNKVAPRREHKLRTFLHVFAACPRDATWLEIPEKGATKALTALVAKLAGCVAQLEQFPVKVHDLPSGASGSGRAGGTSALKFFNTHQLKCNLQRHPACNSLRQWKGGTVKIDPLALVQAIERYLVVRGYGRLRDKDSADSDDETEEDIDDTLTISQDDDESACIDCECPQAAVVISQGSARHKLQFLMGEQPLPYNMTVYQAVRQFGAGSSNSATADHSETDTDSEAPLAHAGLWVQTHTIYYRPAPEDEGSSSSRSVSTCAASSSAASSSALPLHHSRKGKASSKSNARRKEGVVRTPSCPLSPFLQPRLPASVTVSDASLDVLGLLRVLHALSRHWGALYNLPHYTSLLPQQEFVSSKLSAKASRQLQDPLVIMTGNLPAWLQQVASACPFLFPFETRQLLFYATSFDRDRALQRLLEASPELNASDAHERVTPRLDRRKRTVSRSDILRQAEQVVQDLATSRALLEVQYENEVGTGLGPTLEFYALVSRELQRADLELWLGEHVVGGVDGQTQYVHAPHGLFPLPLAKNAKVVSVARAKAKFRFLGRLMAKAVMDSRMLDLPLSLALYRALLSEGPQLSLPDLNHVTPAVHMQLARLVPLARQRAHVEADPQLNAQEKREAQEKLVLDGMSVADIGLDFTLPGFPHIELKKGGKDTPVTIHNLESYVKLVCHWFLVEGVSKQLESLRDGFEAVFPLEHLRLFYPEELEAVFCGAPLGASSAWDVRTLMECCRPDHGYTPDSRAIRFLFEILSSYDREEQRQFLQFVTGSPRLPVGGFKSLNPPLTVVRKTLEPNMDPDEFLPSVMTCVNYLKLPDYSSLEVMRSKLHVAAQEGQHSFHLS